MNWYEIKDKAEAAEVWLYDTIGEDMFGEGTTAKAFVKELNALKAKSIALHINSPGGSVFDGQAIHSAIARHPAKVTAYIDGVAASIAGVIALAADEVVMAANALFMIHDPWGMAMGTSSDIRSYADVLDKVRDTIVGVYQSRTDMLEEDIASLMAAETWMTAEEAYSYGFIDSIGAEMKAAACAFDFAGFGYKHPPVAEAVETEEVREPDPTPEDDGQPVEPSDNDYLGLSVGLSPNDRSKDESVPQDGTGG